MLGRPVKEIYKIHELVVQFPPVHEFLLLSIPLTLKLLVKRHIFDLTVFNNVCRNFCYIIRIKLFYFVSGQFIILAIY